MLIVNYVKCKLCGSYAPEHEIENGLCALCAEEAKITESNYSKEKEEWNSQKEQNLKVKLQEKHLK